MESRRTTRLTLCRPDLVTALERLMKAPGAVAAGPLSVQIGQTSIDLWAGALHIISNPSANDARLPVDGGRLILALEAGIDGPSRSASAPDLLVSTLSSTNTLTAAVVVRERGAHASMQVVMAWRDGGLETVDSVRIVGPGMP